jgi:hypothetical protein
MESRVFARNQAPYSVGALHEDHRDAPDWVSDDEYSELLSDALTEAQEEGDPAPCSDTRELARHLDIGLRGAPLFRTLIEVMGTGEIALTYRFKYNSTASLTLVVGSRYYIVLLFRDGKLVGRQENLLSGGR